MKYVGRLAPSPTGALHLGNARTFMVAWLRARSQGGRLVFRMEDLDHPRDKPGAAAGAVADMRWLGFDWDEEYVQSERRGVYRAALAALRAKGLAYPCVCSRRDVEGAQSAPHAGDQLFYPGTCRGRFAGWRDAADAIAGTGRIPCWRFAVAPGAAVSFEDAFTGRFEQDVSKTLGDFPLARDEDGAGYTLACAVDDLTMGVTEVVRGDDLLAATPAQILVARALDGRQPAFCHVPLVVGPDGRRLAKRHGDTRIAAFREAGTTPEEVIGLLAASCGWAAPGERISLRGLLPRFSLATIPHQPFVWRSPA
ncbi:MAG: tRNA glutamyl-Q(34) synthetase GluQRS [Kiritimatiellae bacterium]|nr:tRNA glutamyl-Q(34) synthetase GluQRS [Kiritimatiellia bacterium]